MSTRRRRPSSSPAEAPHDSTAKGAAVARILTTCLLQLYADFEGDLIAAMVMGAFSRRCANAFSIARATGIPRETVRRRLLMLESKGWLERDSRDGLVMSAGIAKRISAREAELRARVQQELQQTGESHRNSG